MNNLDKNQSPPKPIPPQSQFIKEGQDPRTKPQPPAPPKDRIYKESSLLEIITFGLYKTKKYHRKDEQTR